MSKIIANLTPETDDVSKRLGFQVEHVTGDVRVRAFYRYRTESGDEKRNANGERLVVEVGHCTTPDCKDSLPALWKGYGHTERRLTAWWNISTYVYNKNEECCIRYNPQQKNIPRGKPWFSFGGPSLDFGWILPATVENFDKLLRETLRRFLSCQ